MWLLLTTLGMIFFAELGDKSQFLMIAMTSKYKVRDIIIGVFASIFVLNAIAIAIGSIIAIGIGSAIGGELPMTPISIIAGIAFLYFALSALNGEEDEGEASNKKTSKAAVFAIFGTFFIAELGDKTQLTVLTLTIENASGGFDLGKMLMILGGATIGLFAADVLGLVLGYFLGKNIPSHIFAYISYAIFTVFGIIKLISGFEGLYSGVENSTYYTILTTVGVGMIFAAISIYIIFIKPKKKNER